tara:strand:+ start:468 stop:671 length:204 start_codon:yes stop_codon:yes gene_type:complete
MKLFDSWDFKKQNYIIFTAGILFIILGYFLMSIGDYDSFLSTRLSPVILIVGYCVLIPISIFKNFDN